MIICNSVSKFILKEVDLHIPKGTVVGLIGASGSGKTTFLRLAAGLLQPESGEIYTCRYNPVNDRKKILSRISILLTDKDSYNNSYSVQDRFDDLRDTYRIDKKTFRENLDEIAKELGFADFMEDKQRNLSLGQRRRVELGIAFCRDTDLFLLDEPCMGLDQNGKAAFYDIVKRRKAEGDTFIISSHNAEDILSVADRIILLNLGSVKFYGPTEELYRRLAPVNECRVEYEGNVPDISELETESYEIDNSRMVIKYNSNHVTSKEVFGSILASSTVKSISVKKSDLSVSIKNLVKEET